jgi:hypothetical protein
MVLKHGVTERTFERAVKQMREAGELESDGKNYKIKD